VGKESEESWTGGEHRNGWYLNWLWKKAEICGKEKRGRATVQDRPVRGGKETGIHKSSFVDPRKDKGGK